MKKTLIWILILLLSLPVVFAQDNTDNLTLDDKDKAAEEALKPELEGNPKEEVIYSKLDHQGQVQEVFVVNGFLQNDGHIEDYGQYQRLINLSSDEAINYDKDKEKITVETQSQDFYYQGKTEIKELPWLIEIKYFLNGKEIKGEDLLGKMGLLEVSINVKKNPKVDPLYFDHYVLQMAFNMDARRVHYLQSDEAIIANEGQNKVVTFMHLPKKEKTYHFKGFCYDCELGRIQIAGLPFELALELPDLSAYTKELIQLQDAISQFADGVSELNEGVGTLYNKQGQILSGADELLKAMDRVKGGSESYTQGAKAFQRGLEEFQEGFQTFSQGIDQLTEGMGEFGQGVHQLASASSALAQGTKGYQQGIDQYLDGVKASSDGFKKLKEAMDQLTYGLGQLEEKGLGKDGLYEGSQQILKGFETLDKALSFPLTQEEIELMITVFQNFSQGFNDFTQKLNPKDWQAILDQLTQSLDAFEASMDRINALTATLMDSPGVISETGVDETNEDVQKLLAYMKTKAQAIDEEVKILRGINASLDTLDPLIRSTLENMQVLTDDFDVLKGLINRFNTVLQQTTVEDILKLKDGLKLFSSEYKRFHDGLGLYLQGVKQSHEGAEQIAKGMAELDTGFDQLTEPNAKLKEAGSKLTDGSSQLAQGLKALATGVDTFNGKSSELIDGVQRLEEGTSSLVTNHKSLVSGSQELTSGLNFYRRGLSDFRSGLYLYRDGIGSLYEGTKKLNTGAQSFKEQTRDMDKKVEEKIQATLEEYLPGEYTLKSFMSDKNQTIQKVQFVFLIDEVKHPQEVDSEEEVEQEKSFMDRLRDLFH